jgi:MFS superfamily sulfate permease-like transporter
MEIHLNLSSSMRDSFEVGLVTFLLGIFRLGFLDAVLSRALLRGFITAVGFVIFIEQMSKSTCFRLRFL